MSYPIATHPLAQTFKEPRRILESNMGRILVIDDEEDVREAVRRRLRRDGYTVDVAADSHEASELIQVAEPAFDVIVTDMSMEDPQAGLRVLGAAFARDLFAEVLVLTAYGTVANAVECMRRGAFDYVEKNSPGVDVYEVLSLKVERAMEHRRQCLSTVELWERVAQHRREEQARH